MRLFSFWWVLFSIIAAAPAHASDEALRRLVKDVCGRKDSTIQEKITASRALERLRDVDGAHDILMRGVRQAVGTAGPNQLSAELMAFRERHGYRLAPAKVEEENHGLIVRMPEHPEFFVTDSDQTNRAEVRGPDGSIQARLATRIPVSQRNYQFPKNSDLIVITTHSNPPTRAEIWTRDGQLKAEIERFMGISQDGKIIYKSDSSVMVGTNLVCDDRGKPIEGIQPFGPGKTTYLQIYPSPDGKKLIQMHLNENRYFLQVLNWDGTPVGTPIRLREKPEKISFAPNGTLAYLKVPTNTKLLDEIVDMESGQTTPKFKDLPSPVTIDTFYRRDPSGKHILVQEPHGKATVYREDLSILGTFEVGDQLVQQFFVSPNGVDIVLSYTSKHPHSLISYGPKDIELRTLEGSKFAKVFPLSNPVNPSPLRAVIFSPTGDRFILKVSAPIELTIYNRQGERIESPAIPSTLVIPDGWERTQYQYSLDNVQLAYDESYLFGWMSEEARIETPNEIPVRTDRRASFHPVLIDWNGQITFPPREMVREVYEATPEALVINAGPKVQGPIRVLTWQRPVSPENP